MIHSGTDREERSFFMPGEPPSGGDETPSTEPASDVWPEQRNSDNAAQRLLRKAQEELAAAKQELQAIKEAELSEVERLKKQAADLEERARSSELENLRRKIVQEENLPVDALEYLSGRDEEALRSSARKLLTLIGSKAAPSAGSRTQPGGGQLPSLDEQIAAAERLGNRALSISLKNQKMRGS